MRWIKLTILFVIICSKSFASEYHVTISGSDTNDCSELNPCASISHVCSILSSGDILKVHGDGDSNTIDYYGTNSCVISGVQDSPIIISAYDANDRPLMSWKLPYSGGWSNIGTNLWKSNTSFESDATRDDLPVVYLYNSSNGQVVILTKETSSSNVNQQNEYYVYLTGADTGKVLIYSTSNPETFQETVHYVSEIKQSSLQYSTPLYITGAYVNVSNINFIMNGEGIAVLKGSNNILLENIDSGYGVNRGIDIQEAPSFPTYNITLKKVYAHHSIPSMLYFSNPDQHGIKLSNLGNTSINGSNVNIIDCMSYNNGYHGIQISEGWQGINVIGGVFHSNGQMVPNDDVADIRMGTSIDSYGFLIDGVETYGTKNGISLYFNINDLTVKNSYIHDALNAGIRIDAFYDGTSCQWNNCNIFNNLIINSEGSGLLIDDVENYNAYNNTLVNNLIGIYFPTNAFYPIQSGTIKNNIVIGETGDILLQIDSNVNYLSDYNAWYSPDSTPFSYNGSSYNFSDYKTASGQDANSISSDFTGEFIDYASGNYRLTPSSTTLKDAGTTLSLVPYDKLGQIRPQGFGYSIGAYEEYIEGTTVGGLTITGATIN